MSSAFTSIRTPFAFVNGTLYFDEVQNDHRECKQWLAEDYGVTPKAFRNTRRGYISTGRIQLFKGENYEKLNLADISVSDMCKLIAMYQVLIGSGHVLVCNGVKVGTVGDIWEPIDVVFELEL